MTRDDIIRMAREAGLALYVNDVTEEPYALTLERFAALVAAAEREACAKVCEERKSKYEERASKPEHARDIDPEVARIAQMTCYFNAAAIRTRVKV